MKRRLFALLIAAAMLLLTVPAALAETGTGTAKGFGGDVTVTVTVEDGVITAVEAAGDSETDGIGKNIIAEWPQVMVDNNGIVDTYTGATFAGITREGFIEAAKAALAEAGVNPDDYMREFVAEAGEDQILEADVVIVGAGGAGMTAAINAADAGMRVIIVESQPAVGGNSVKSTGGMNAAKTVYQDENEFGESAGVEKTLATAAEKWADNETITALAATVKEQWDAYQADPQGYFDSTELFALDTMIGGKGINDPALVDTLVNNSAEAIDWLRGEGINLTDVASFGGASVKRIHRPLNEEGKVVSVGAYTVPLLE
ncbi:MAG: FAD-dependent oxidoreductase, partial [Clostridia bacterium]|nr:FAD-dependent oxidoreductase [Clostridia bacterium]